MAHTRIWLARHDDTMETIQERMLKWLSRHSEDIIPPVQAAA